LIQNGKGNLAILEKANLKENNKESPQKSKKKDAVNLTSFDFPATPIRAITA
jgi:hypothetical protein